MDLLKELAEAFLDGDEHIRYFYNKATQEIIVPTELDEEDLLDDETLELVPSKQSYEMYKVMDEFILQLDITSKQPLMLALKGKKPFSTFKEAAIQLNVIDQWYAFELDYAKTVMQEWLEQLD